MCPHSLPIHSLHDLHLDLLLVQGAQHPVPPVLPAFQVYHENLRQEERTRNGQSPLISVSTGSGNDRENRGEGWFTVPIEPNQDSFPLSRRRGLRLLSAPRCSLMSTSPALEAGNLTLLFFGGRTEPQMEPREARRPCGRWVSSSADPSFCLTVTYRRLPWTTSSTSVSPFVKLG